MKKVEGSLKAIDGYGATFHQIAQHSPIAGIREASKVFTDAGCDVIVSVGGGSPVDAAKAILYYLQQERGGETMPQIAIPTTLSAAEYSVRSSPRPARDASLIYFDRSGLGTQTIVERRWLLALRNWRLQPLFLTRSSHWPRPKIYGITFHLFPFNTG